VIGLFPQTFHQHVATLLVYAGLFSSFLFTAITRFFAQEYRWEKLWMDNKISEFQKDLLAFLCLCFFIFSLIAFLISHLPVIADAESVKRKRITHSVVLIFFDLYIFFSVFTKPNSAQKVFDLSGDALVFNWILIFPISAICLFITMQSLIRSLEPKEKTENRDIKNRILVQAKQQIEADFKQARQAAADFIRDGNNQRKGGRIFELNQQICFAANDRTARRVMQKTEWMEWMEWMEIQAVARLTAKAQFEEAADALAEATQAIFLEYPEVPTSQTTIDIARMITLELDLRGALSNAQTCLSKCQGVLSDKQIGHHQSELIKLRWELEDRFGFQNLK